MLANVSPAVDIDEQTDQQLREIAGRSGRPVPSEIHDAVGQLHRSLIGTDDSTQLGIPFKKRYADRDADVVVRQIDPNNFRLEEPFRFTHGSDPDVIVERGNITDLASVPTFLTWLVPRYGRHTLPALLHDQVVEERMDPDVRERADATFRDNMGATKVPLVRRWSMWAAVSLATHWQRSLRSRLLVVVWIGLYALAGLDVMLRLLRWRPFPAISSAAALAIIVASPVLLSLIWGRRYRVGIIAAYSVLVLFAAIVVVGLTLVIYLAAEGIAQGILRLQQRRDVTVRINPVRVSKL
jgi:hypothetical protein